MAHKRTQRRPVKAGPKGGQAQPSRRRQPGSAGAVPNLSFGGQPQIPTPFEPQQGTQRKVTKFQVPSPLEQVRREREQRGFGPPTRERGGPTEQAPLPTIPGADQEFIDLQARLREMVDKGQITRQRAQMILLEQDLLRRQRQERGELVPLFQQQLGAQVGAQVAGARAGLSRSLGRRGLTGSGLEQAAEQQLQAAASAQTAQSLGEFQQRLLAVEQAERQAFRTRSTEFLRNMFELAQRRDIQEMMLRIQEDISRDQARMGLLGNIGQAAGIAIGTIGAAAVSDGA